MPRPKSNYSAKEYLLLIAIAESLEELALLKELLNEDRDNRCFDPYQYIDLMAVFMLRQLSLTIDEKERQDW